MKMKRTQRKGFTLIEMLVVIAIIALLASILVPAVTGALGQANKTKVMSNGTSIYKSIFATITDVGAQRSGIQYFAESDSDDYSNSTDYFIWLMEDYDNEGVNVLPQDFQMFTAQGLDTVNEISEFDGDSNAWSVVTDLTPDSESSVPFLITRNLNETELQTWSNNTDRPQNVGTGTYEDPYGEESVIVIRIGGAGEILNESGLFWSVINPTKAENTIYDPGSGGGS